SLPFLAALGLLYAGVFVWLGWRKFATMEFRDASLDSSVSIAVPQSHERRFSLLRCRPTGNFANLVRKDIRLQKPIFLIGVASAACLFVAIAAVAFPRKRVEIFTVVFGGLTVIHILLVSLLTGSISLGEEKALGLAAWHMTLPASAQRQWFVKILVAAATIAL